MRLFRWTGLCASVLTTCLLLGACSFSLFAGAGDDIQRGAAAFTDYRNEKPGTIRQITVADLPQPFATSSSDNRPTMVPRPP